MCRLRLSKVPRSVGGSDYVKSGCSFLREVRSKARQTYRRVKRPGGIRAGSRLRLISGGIGMPYPALLRGSHVGTDEARRGGKKVGP